MQDILSMKFSELQMAIKELQEPDYRAKQIYHWLHVRKIQEFSQMTDLSSGLKLKLASNFEIKKLVIAKKLESQIDDTVKYLYQLPDGQYIETVLMHYQHGWRICISTQVGCKMGCQFCASTIAGYVRNLTASEMLLQIDETERNANIKISGIVLMGIGEPLDNFQNVMRFLELLSDSKGRKMSLRHVTISTCGIVPKIRELAEKKTGLTLAVSLHQASDSQRNKIMPVNKKYALQELMNACQYYFAMTGRRVTYEYAVMDGENDSFANAQALAKLLKNQQAHVNLIPVNTVKERNYHATRQSAKRFMQYLEKLGVHATVRRTLGSDIQAACGQLRHEINIKNSCLNFTEK
ncbi:MAG: 23S rRNA (adenine(2503)-C(2))-methyltransferase RlmN [Oscillospiraceae bacterium]|nr:23S rRNA (adenine(2503)-C(2))-methyltransferase RlmN [Oscillospiraceae bacterium]